MKIRPLPDMDLARIAPMDRDQKRRELEKMKTGHPPYSYEPFRRELLDILNVTPGPLATGARTSWAVVSAAVSKRAKTLNEATANLSVAEALYKYGLDQNISGRGQEFLSLTVGISQKVSFWSPAVIELCSKATVLFIDPRRSKKLSADARRFVFSVMNERIRAADPDYANVKLGIIQFSTKIIHLNGQSNLIRTPKLFLDDDVVHFQFDELDSMVRETYEVWNEVLQERSAEMRRKATGTSGPLGI